MPPETPEVKTVLVVGTDPTRTSRVTAASSSRPHSQRVHPRDFGPRSQDDIYLSTPADHRLPQGRDVASRDIYRVLFGGTDFATGEPIETSEHTHAERAIANTSPDDAPADPTDDPRRHPVGHLDGVVRGRNRELLTPEFDADQVWRLIHDHKVNLLFFTGDAMARPLLDALLAHQDAGNTATWARCFLLASTAALFSTSLKEKFLGCCPTGSSPTPSAPPKPVSAERVWS